MSIRKFVSVQDLTTELYGACNLRSNSDFAGLPSDQQERIAVLLRDFPQALILGVSELTLVSRIGDPYIVLITPGEQNGDQVCTLDTKRSITVPLTLELKGLGQAINAFIATNYSAISFLNKTWDAKTRTFYVAGPTIDFRVGVREGTVTIYGPGDARALRYYCGTSNGVYKKVNDALQELFGKWGSSAER